MAAETGSRFGLIGAVLVLAFLHFALTSLFDSWFANPNLLLCAVLVSARQLRPGAAAAVGFTLGVLEDSMAVSHFGLATLLLVLVAYLGSLTRDTFVGEEPLFIGTYLFVGTWVYETGIFLILGASGDPLSYIFLRAPLDGLATAVIGYLTLPFLRA
ncbi:MAG: rod shape-determining protein MreD, partial [Gemmatimonadetes bacterium]|nr:rod shape-determining protein MreD [Gemmatimonadota bacterium]NIO30704.1 rod shape-determining protein MreD [Gemmatimonadota bacterium]